MAAATADNSADEFFESLDRVLSSSSTSTSDNSDGEGDGGRGEGSESPFTSLSMWLTTPAPVADRRRRLLQLMDLGADAAFSRSASCGGAFPLPPPVPSLSHSPAAVQVARSRSDGAGEAEDPRRLIKSLDDGREFLVVEEDKKMREVGTGRHFTIEEFERCVGRSPIVHELMRRASENCEKRNGNVDPTASSTVAISSSEGGIAATVKRPSSWFSSIKNAVAVSNGNGRERRSSDESGGRRSSSATDDSQDGPYPQRMIVDSGPERVKVRHYGKQLKDFSGLYMNQRIEGHNGSIWSIKFSVDGRYLASAGEDRVIQVWEVSEVERKEEIPVERRFEESAGCNPFAGAMSNGSPERTHAPLLRSDGSYYEKKRRAKASGSRRSGSVDHLVLPELVFALSEKPVCLFRGHTDDVLDLSWSISMHLLSSSMDKTVRLWHMSSQSCLKIFSHSDYVTCIQFNPLDDRYFISGSLDEKVRLWSIPDRQIVDWFDIHEMVTAVCFNPDGQSALVGSHKGSCYLYDTSENKLLQKIQVDLQNKKRKSDQKKITGFQFVPGRSSRVIITSAGSRIRVIDGIDLVHKFKGFRNTNSQISASLTPDHRYVISASEDSHVYIWQYDDNPDPGRSKGVVSVTNSYEHFYSQDITVAVPWPCYIPRTSRSNSGRSDDPDQAPKEVLFTQPGPSDQDTITASNELNRNPSRPAVTWSEEFVTASKLSRLSSTGSFHQEGTSPGHCTWGLVIVTASRRGELRVYQNYGAQVGG